jgi:hypothetical protein
MVWGWLKKFEDHWDSGGIPVKIKIQKKESDHHQLFSYNTKRFAYALLFSNKKTCREQAPSAGVNGPQSASKIPIFLYSHAGYRYTA